MLSMDVSVHCLVHCTACWRLSAAAGLQLGPCRAGGLYHAACFERGGWNALLLTGDHASKAARRASLCNLDRVKGGRHALGSVVCIRGHCFCSVVTQIGCAAVGGVALHLLSMVSSVRCACSVFIQRM
jgi:hypothetical protein